MDEASEFLAWKRDFSWGDDGVHAFLSIKKLREVTHIVAMKKEGWEDELEAVLYR